MMSVPAHLGVDAEIELIGVLEPRNDGRLGRLLLGVVGLRQQADAECARTLGQHQRIVTQTHCALTGAEQTEREDGVTPSQHRKEKTKNESTRASCGDKSQEPSGAHAWL